jgi:uncharacterized membrane protein YidH (DUF202 family)
MRLRASTPRPPFIGTPPPTDSSYLRSRIPDNNKPQHVQAPFRFVLLSSYVFIWIANSFLVHAGGENNAVSPSSAVLNCIVEALKLLVAVTAFVVDRRLRNLDAFQALREFATNGHAASCLWRFTPVALLYAISSNLMMFNLRTNQPTTYHLLISSRLLLNAVAWQYVFNEKIPNPRRLALLVITAGIVLQRINDALSFPATATLNPSSTRGEGEIRTSTMAFLIILVQAICSVLASVYNEKKLKQEVHHLHLQNACLYSVSILINLVVAITMPPSMGGAGGITDIILSAKGAIISPMYAAIICTLAAAGVMTSLVIRYESSIVKGIASAQCIHIPLIEKVIFGQGNITVVVLFASSACVSAGIVLWVVNTVPTIPNMQLGEYRKWIRGSRLLYFGLAISIARIGREDIEKIHSKETVKYQVYPQINAVLDPYYRNIAQDIRSTWGADCNDACPLRHCSVKAENVHVAIRFVLREWVRITSQVNIESINVYMVLSSRHFTAIPRL